MASTDCVVAAAAGAASKADLAVPSDAGVGTDATTGPLACAGGGGTAAAALELTVGECAIWGGCAIPGIGAPDAGTPDAGVLDAGVPEVGVLDVGMSFRSAAGTCGCGRAGELPFSIAATLAFRSEG